jgi:hypothetical protein
LLFWIRPSLRFQVPMNMNLAEGHLPESLPGLRELFSGKFRPFHPRPGASGMSLISFSPRRHSAFVQICARPQHPSRSQVERVVSSNHASPYAVGHTWIWIHHPKPRSQLERVRPFAPQSFVPVLSPASTGRIVPRQYPGRFRCLVSPAASTRGHARPFP